MADIELVIKIDANVYTRLFDNGIQDNEIAVDDICEMARALRLGKPLPKCKDCKYFEYDSVAKVDGVPLIVAHEICTTWGDGCKTKEDGYCFMFEPQESKDNCDTCIHYKADNPYCECCFDLDKYEK